MPSAENVEKPCCQRVPSPRAEKRASQGQDIRVHGANLGPPQARDEGCGRGTPSERDDGLRPVHETLHDPESRTHRAPALSSVPVERLQAWAHAIRSAIGALQRKDGGHTLRPRQREGGILGWCVCVAPPKVFVRRRSIPSSPCHRDRGVQRARIEGGQVESRARTAHGDDLAHRIIPNGGTAVCSWGLPSGWLRGRVFRNR
jgi:hypothetical protein